MSQNKQEVPLYDLNNSYFFYEDIELILDEISNLYDIEFKSDRNVYMPKTTVSTKHFWLSDECKKAFNKMIPKFKSLTKDMYSIIESIYKSKTGNFNISVLETRYMYFKEFRLFNNKLKHFEVKRVDIKLSEMVLMAEKGHLIDTYLYFDYLNNDKSQNQAIRYSDFIDIFLSILEDENIISINRAQ